MPFGGWSQLDGEGHQGASDIEVRSESLCPCETWAPHAVETALNHQVLMFPPSLGTICQVLPSEYLIQLSHPLLPSVVLPPFYLFLSKSSRAPGTFCKHLMPICIHFGLPQTGLSQVLFFPSLLRQDNWLMVFQQPLRLG